VTNLEAPTRERASGRAGQEVATGLQRDQADVASRDLYAGSLSPGDKVVIAYLGILALLILIARERIPSWWLLIAGHLLVIAFIALLATLHRGDSGVVMLARCWYPPLLIPLTFKELTHLIPLLRPRDFDWELAAIDYRMFGVNPTVWLERFTHPLLTELLQLSYMAYYLLPLVLGLVLWKRGSMRQFHFLLFVVVLGFYLSYFGYIAVPAIGPRFILADQQAFPLKGVLLFETLQAALNRAEGITRDCFPSGHTALTLLMIYYARRFHWPSYRWMLPVGSALIIATVYLRYHYVIDVIAGAGLAALVISVAAPLYKLLGGPFHKHSTPDGVVKGNDL
jgi:membrane-associated phospholipid phosphatase